MKLTCHEVDHPWISIEDFYNEEDLRMVWEELEFLSYPHKLLPPDKTTAAVKDGKILKKNAAVFLDHLYANRGVSNILSVNRKLLNCNITNDHNLDIFKNHDNWFFKYYKTWDDFTMISYYEDSDYYLPHDDKSGITAITWFFKEPKRFTGGDLIFPHTKEKIECKNNKIVVFPSCVVHQATEIKMEKKYQGQRLGRYAMSQFLSPAPTL